jgi:hypothetical protein
MNESAASPLASCSPLAYSNIDPLNMRFKRECQRRTCRSRAITPRGRSPVHHDISPQRADASRIQIQIVAACRQRRVECIQLESCRRHISTGRGIRVVVDGARLGSTVVAINGMASRRPPAINGLNRRRAIEYVHRPLATRLRVADRARHPRGLPRPAEDVAVRVVATVTRLATFSQRATPLRRTRTGFEV